ncbi:hypothetical protein M0R45_002503 [Rubus argutus]|uniref:Uncharacterized protein n=1 Tax=Rubus argutus TaxID=59490 RepID=A0AAW1VRC8_RUBAR
MDVEGANSMNHVIIVTKCTIEKLCEMGIIASNNGGSLVPILNLSWKGVVTLLQLGDGVLATKVNVADIILKLISLVNESLRRSAEAWSSSLKENISVTEARKAFLPEKFYLINAVKISSLYPYQAYLVRKLLEKTSLDLLIALLNSTQVKRELKVEILDSLFSEGICTNSMAGDLSKMNSLVEIFSTCGESLPGERTLLLGRVSLFLSFLRFSLDLDNDVKLGISGKLGWFLDIPAWRELESFLLENLFHPHLLCWEIIMELWCFMVRRTESGMVSGIAENFDEKSMRSLDCGVFGAPVFALSASLQSLQISTSDMNVKTLKFLVAIIHNYRVCADKLMKDQHCNLLSETLGIISNMKHLYASLEMEKVISELENLFISGPAVSDTRLYECKPHLALFMAGLAHMDIKETDESSKISALWDLYHMLLGDRHWAFIHLAITAFGYFSARTNCNKLWRFVPQNAALSYDLASGNEASLERFTSEFKVFLEKETALLTITPSSDENVKTWKLMVKKQATGINSGEQSNRKRKFPDGIERGMELLQSSMKVIVDSISQLQQNDQPSSNELLDKFLTTFSCLEDDIAQLVGLAGSD